MTKKHNFYSDFDAEIQVLYQKTAEQIIYLEQEKSELLENIVGLYKADTSFRKPKNEQDLYRIKRLEYISDAKTMLWQQFYDDRELQLQLRFNILDENGRYFEKSFFKTVEQFSDFINRQFNPCRARAWRNHSAANTGIKV